MNRIIISWFFIVVLLNVSCRTDKDRALEKGNRFFASANYPEAEINFKKAIQQDPSLGEAYYKLGLAQSRESHVQEAYATLNRARDLLPGRDDVAAAAADASLAMYIRVSPSPGYYNQVAATAEQLLNKDPKSFDGLRLKGFIAMIDRHYPEAIELLKSANSVKPMQEDIVHALAQCLIQDGQTADGEKLALDLIQKRSAFGPAYDTLYEFYANKNRSADAEAILKKKVSNNPDVIDYRLQLAAYYARIQNEAELTKVVGEMTEDPKRFPEARIRAGNLYLSLNRLDDSLAQFQAGVNENTARKSEFRKRIAQILMIQGKNDQALGVLTEILKEKSGDYDARNMRAIINVDSANAEKTSEGLAELKVLAVEKPADAVVRYNLGRAELRQGDVDGALLQFNESIRLDPRLIESRYLAANVSLRKGDYNQASQYADDILKVKSDDPVANLLKVESLTGMGNFNEANTEATRLNRDYPRDAGPKLEMAEVKLAESKFDEADALFRSVYTVDRRNMRALQGILKVYYAQNRYDQAIEFVTQEAAKNDSPEVHSLIADAALRGGKVDLAIKQYSQLEGANPTSYFEHMRLGDALLQKGNSAGAVAEFQTAKSLAPKDKLVSAMLALSLRRAGRLPEAKKAYSEALALDSANPLIMNNLAYLMAESGDNLDEALRLAQNASRIQPANDSLSDTLGWVYLKKNMTDSAVQIFSNVSEKNPDQAVYRYHLALALLQKGDKSGARRELEAALTKRPNPDDQAKIGELLAKTR